MRVYHGETPSQIGFTPNWPYRLLTGKRKQPPRTCHPANRTLGAFPGAVLIGGRHVPKKRPKRGAEEAERPDLEKQARLEAGLIDPVSAIQPALTAEHQHREGLTFWQAIKTMFK